MNIDIDDGDPFDPAERAAQAATATLLYRQKPIGRCALGVVPGRPDQRECRSLAFEGVFGGLNSGSGRQSRDGDASRPM